MSNTIRIPRTTAMFVTNLGQILRNEFKLKINVHEHWTFEQVAKWEECFNKGECHTHGISDEFQARKEANPDDQSLWWADCHYPYKMEVYLGTGSLRAGADAVEIRARITKTHNLAFGVMIKAEVWVKVADQKIQRGHFYLDTCIDHSQMRCDDPMSALPPERISFSCKEEIRKPQFVFPRSAPLQLTTQEKRIARQKVLIEASKM